MSDYNLFHASIQTKEILNVLVNENTKTVFDGTLGLGGHAKAILSQYSQIEFYVGTDLDLQHLYEAKKNLSPWESKIHLFNTNFSDVKNHLTNLSVAHPLAVLMDLGICSNQLDDASKGFAFSADGPLKMTFDSNQEYNAEIFLNESSLEEITEVLRNYGEEPLAYKIAKSIIQVREESPLTTTLELTQLVDKCSHPKERKKTLARVFQAIRIEVNQELEHLKKALNDAWDIMKPGDRMGIITFHSLEDRMVKDQFKTWSKPVTKPGLYSNHEIVSPATGKLVNKKPILPEANEIAENSRARSAKFRVIEKI